MYARTRNLLSLLAAAAAVAALALSLPAQGKPSMGADPAQADQAALNQSVLHTLDCIGCHQQDVDEVKASMHYRVAAPNDFALFPGGGAHGMYDRACSLPGSTSLINYKGAAPELNECGKCHVGRYMSGTEQMLAMAMQGQGMGQDEAAQQAKHIVDGGIDCMVCHAEQYAAYPAGNEDHAAYSTLFEAEPGVAPQAPTPIGFPRYGHEPDPFGLDFDGDGQPDKVVAQDRSPATIASMGRTTTHACLRCHEHDFTGFKRGTPFEADYDVHAAAFEDRNQCTRCHTTQDHKFERGKNVNGDFVGTDLGHSEETLTCARCHEEGGEGPVPSGAIHSEAHLDRMACETCHNPYTSGINYSVWADGVQLAFGRDPETGRDTRLITLDALLNDATNETVDHEAGHLDMMQDHEAFATRPVYMWFDADHEPGVPGTSFLAQPLITSGDPLAKITPFKPMANGLVFDQRFFTDRQASDFDVNAGGGQFSRYSMYNFYFQGANADVFSAFGLLGNEAMGMPGTLPGEVRDVTLMGDFANFADPDRQALALLQIFPNMVYFLKSSFGYDYYVVADGHPEADADGDGVVDSGSDFFFDLLQASNDGLEAFKGFNPMFGIAPETDWYPPFEDAGDLMTMKLPDGSLMRIYLQLKDGMADDDPGTFHPERYANYPAYSNGVTLGHAIAGADTTQKPLGYGAEGCAECHSADGAFMTPVPVTKTETVGPFESFGGMSFQMPRYRWVYYNARALVDLGLEVESGDVLAGSDSADIAGDPQYVREGETDFMLNWLDPQGYMTADDPAMLPDGVQLMRHDGAWVAVLEPVVEMRTNWEILGYQLIRDEGDDAVVGLVKPDGGEMTYWISDEPPVDDDLGGEPDAGTPDATDDVASTEDAASDDAWTDDVGPTLDVTTPDTSAPDATTPDEDEGGGGDSGGCNAGVGDQAPTHVLLVLLACLALALRRRSIG